MYSENDGAYTFAEYYAARASLLRTTLRRFIIGRPQFWRRILVDAYTALDHLFFCLQQTAGSPYHLEIWLSDPDAFTQTGRFGGLDRFIVKTMGILAPSFHRCLSIRIHAASPSVVSAVMDCFSDFTPTQLANLITVYNIDTYAQYRPEEFNQFLFKVDPSFGLMCPPALSLAVSSGANIYPSIVYTSAAESEIVLTCPHDDPPTWWELVSILASTTSLRHLSLTDIACSALPGLMAISPPLGSIRNLDIVFNSNYQMAATLARLLFPSLDSVKFTIASRADMECLAMCGALLSSAAEVTIAGDCLVVQGLGQIFRMMFQVQVLDLSEASIPIWNEFYSASSIRVQHGTNRYACPYLVHLFVPDLELKVVKRLMQTRARSNYPKLSSVIMPDENTAYSANVLNWFRMQGIEVNTV